MPELARILLQLLPLLKKRALAKRLVTCVIKYETNRRNPNCARLGQKSKSALNTRRRKCLPILKGS